MTLNQPTLLVATHNPAKLKRYQKQLADLQVNLVSLADIDVQIEPPEEIGQNTLEIVKNKVKFYFEKTQKPCFSSDSGLYFEGVSESEQPGKNVKGIAGAKDNMSDEEIFEKMIDFYSKLATKYGGQLNGYFLDSYCLFDGQNHYSQEVKRPIVLTNKIHKKDIHFPICSLYTVGGKYYHDLSEAEMADFLAPSMAGLKKVIFDWLENS